MAKITDEIAKAFNTSNEHIFENTVYKLKEPTSTPISEYDYTIMRRDIDTNNHVHNLNYLDIAMEALPEDVYNNCNFSNVEVMYKHQAVYKDKTKAFYYNINNEHYIVIKSDNLEKIHCIIKLS